MTSGHDLSRRRILTGAAWTAPAIVVASATPSYAGSPPGDPNVTAIVQPTADADNTLPVTIRFQNSGPGSTGLLVVDVFLTTNLAQVNGTLSTADPTSVSQGWQFQGATGSVQRRILTFANALGIPGTTDPLSPTMSVLSFNYTVVPSPTTGQSSGDISVFFDRINGPRPTNAEGAWL